MKDSSFETGVGMILQLPMASGTMRLIDSPVRFLSDNAEQYSAFAEISVEVGKENFCKISTNADSVFSLQIPKVTAALVTITMPIDTAEPWET